MLEELFDMIKENCDGDEKQIIEFGNELVEYILNSKDFVGELSERLDQFALQNNRCPACGRELEIKINYEGSEYQELPVQEEINEKYCPKHGFIN